MRQRLYLRVARRYPHRKAACLRHHLSDFSQELEPYSDSLVVRQDHEPGDPEVPVFIGEFDERDEAYWAVFVDAYEAFGGCVQVLVQIVILAKQGP